MSKKPKKTRRDMAETARENLEQIIGEPLAEAPRCEKGEMKPQVDDKPAPTKPSDQQRGS